VQDTKACIDALHTFENIDTAKIFLLGNTVGGQVALFTAATDERVSGVATVAAYSPLRLADSRYESIRSFSHWHGLLPRLGWYASEPAKAPVDFPEIISCIAPRPLMVIAPAMDRYSNVAEIKKGLAEVKKVYTLYAEPNNLKDSYPEEINRITESMHAQISDFFSGILTTTK
jgi:hypothetical protein